MKLSCILSFGCSNLRYVTTRLIGGGLDGAKAVEVHKCLDCGREVIRENDR